MRAVAVVVGCQTPAEGKDNATTSALSMMACEWAFLGYVAMAGAV